MKTFVGAFTLHKAQFHTLTTLNAPASLKALITQISMSTRRLTSGIKSNKMLLCYRSPFGRHAYLRPVIFPLAVNAGFFHLWGAQYHEISNDRGSGLHRTHPQIGGAQVSSFTNAISACTHQQFDSSRSAFEDCRQRQAICCEWMTLSLKRADFGDWLPLWNLTSEYLWGNSSNQLNKSRHICHFANSRLRIGCKGCIR